MRAAGSHASGNAWEQTGRTKRSIVSAPTEVVRASPVAGKGPPWTTVRQTSTPAGQPLTRTRPALRSSRGKSFAASGRSASARFRRGAGLDQRQFRIAAGDGIGFACDVEMPVGPQVAQAGHGQPDQPGQIDPAQPRRDGPFP